MKYILIGLIVISAWQTALGQNSAYNNPEIVSENTLPARSYFVPYPDELSAQNEGFSDRQLSLNGDWLFKLITGKDNVPQNYYSKDFNTTDWRRLPVPSNWQTHGYGLPVYSNTTLDVEPDEVGLYRTTFAASITKGDRRMTLRFEGVKTAFHVHVNGKYVGYAAPAFLPTEFDITDYLNKSGENNLLSVAVYRTAAISKIENFDTWRLSGIFRDVDLLSRPLYSIRDVEINSPMINGYKDGRLSLHAFIRNDAAKKGEELKLHVKLISPDKQVKKEELLQIKSVPSGAEVSINYLTTVEDAESWNAENPNLYKILISLMQGERILETIAFQVGFRTIEVKDGGQLMVNGKKIYLKGVNRHDWNPVTGRAVSKQDMRDELMTMKQNNINAIRTSHYPNHSYLTQLTDELGIYVMAEAAMETHWVTHAEQDPRFKEAHLSRIQNLMERDKNHPSIILWSLGNEFHFGPNTAAMYHYVLKRDTSRLVYSDEKTPDIDFAIKATAYNTINSLVEGAKERKPVIMKEYMHAAGNSMGLFAKVWDTIRSENYKPLAGGFIWDWRDQGWLVNPNTKDAFYDWGVAAGIAATGNDGIDGIISSDLSPTPKLLEVAATFEDIKVKLVDAKAGKFCLYNRHSFRSMSEFSGRYTLSVNGEKIKTECLPDFKTEAGQQEFFDIGFGNLGKQTTNQDDIQVFFEFFDKANGNRVAWDQSCLQKGNMQIVLDKTATGLACKVMDKAVIVNTGALEINFNTQLGKIISIKNDGKEMLYRMNGPQLNFWRAPTDCDLSTWGGLAQKYYKPWRDLGLDDSKMLTHTPKDFTIITNTDKEVCFDIKTTIAHAGKTIAECHYRYRFFPGGVYSIGVNFSPGKEMAQLEGLPRLGLVMQYNKAYNQLKWYGYGPHENYRDRIESAWVDNFERRPEQLYVPYISPQTNGNRSGIRNMGFGNDEIRVSCIKLSKENVGNIAAYLPGGQALYMTAEPTFEFSAIPYTESQLEKADYPEELLAEDKFVLSLDNENAGVATHPRPGRYPEHEVKPKATSFAFLFQAK
jgi:beta-galactosidase